VRVPWSGSRCFGKDGGEGFTSAWLSPLLVENLKGLFMAGECYTRYTDKSQLIAINPVLLKGLIMVGTGADNCISVYRGRSIDPDARLLRLRFGQYVPFVINFPSCFFVREGLYFELEFGTGFFTFILTDV